MPRGSPCSSSAAGQAARGCLGHGALIDQPLPSTCVSCTLRRSGGPSLLRLICEKSNSHPPFRSPNNATPSPGTILTENQSENVRERNRPGHPQASTTKRSICNGAINDRRSSIADDLCARLVLTPPLSSTIAHADKIGVRYCRSLNLAAETRRYFSSRLEKSLFAGPELFVGRA